MTAVRDLRLPCDLHRHTRIALRHRSRRTGAFSYRTAPPAGVDSGRVQARFDGGVLTVQVPRPEGSKPHRVKID
jgi:HSP20 family protein